MYIGSKEVKTGAVPLIIAEAGTAHGGNLDRAYELISRAEDAGADCIKFQAVFADEIIHHSTGMVRLPGGSIDLYKSFKALEKDEEFFKSIKAYAEDRGLLFLCTPFGIKSARILKKLNVKAVKIASPELNHFPLLREVAAYHVPVILSTGVSKLCDIEKALKITGKDTVLLHCVTSYPAPEEDYNLKLIENLNRIFGIVTGVSDHSPDPVLVPVLSAVQGAAVIEKHFTISRSNKGLDDSIALEPDDFKKMVEEVKAVYSRGAEETLLYLEKLYGRTKVAEVLGDGIKRLSPAEENNYITTNRSIHAVKSIKAGDVLSAENIALLRTEKNLKPGMHPEMLDVIIGRRAARDIADGSGIVPDDLLSERDG
ncbi:MAG: spore coat protein [Spirochaetes bacterium]|nr:spore coat protein [Spirochaetota bacterium]